MPTHEEFLQVKEAAEYLGVSQNTIRNWGRSEKLPEYRHPLNNYRLYKKRDVVRLLKALHTPNKSKTAY